MQNSMRKLKLTLTIVLTLTDTGGPVLTLTDTGGAVLTLMQSTEVYTLHGNSSHLR